MREPAGFELCVLEEEWVMTMAGAEIGRHNETLQSWKCSSSQTRQKITGEVEFNPHGHYSVRMEGSSQWIKCQQAPADGAAEWLYINFRGVPVFYWDKWKNAIVLID